MQPDREQPDRREPGPERPPLGSWAKTYGLVLLLHVAWLALLLAMTLRWNRVAS